MKMLFTPKRSASLRLAVLLGISLLWNLAYAAGATGPPGLKSLAQVLLQISIYPFIGVALAFLVFKATKKVWVFVLIPFFYCGLSTLAPIVPAPAPTPEESQALYYSVVAWLYLPLILATAIGYWIHSRTKRVWIFVLVPVLGWLLQFVGLVFIIQFMNRTVHL